MCNEIIPYTGVNSCRNKVTVMYEWPDGFTPYWVYDKYGSRKSETITECKVVMEKVII